MTTAICGERLIEDLRNHNIPMQLVFIPSTIWCGSVAFSTLTAEPDISKLLEKYQKNCQFSKFSLANRDWNSAISINYWQEGKVPRGMMFAQQVTSDVQNPLHDIYRMPQSLFIRVECTAKVAQSAFGREGCEVWELFGVIKDALDDYGYKFAENGAQEIEMYNHGLELAYAYVPVEEKTLQSK